MRILVDIDGVLNNMQQVLLEILNAHYDCDFNISDITYYDWLPDTFENPWQFIEEDKNFWDRVTINPQAVEVIEKNIEKHNEVYLVTASYFTPSLSKKIQTTLSHFKSLTDHNVIVTQDKFLIQGDFLIDDCIAHLSKFDGNKLLYNRPWNQTKLLDHIRVKNWQEIDDVLTFYNY